MTTDPEGVRTGRPTGGTALAMWHPRAGRGRFAVADTCMCYSARLISDYRRYLREFGAGLSLDEFVEVFWRRRTDPRIKVPKAMEVAFMAPQNAQEQRIRDLIVEHQAAERTRLEQELFKQRKRLADAERRLQQKPTKTAAEEQRIATERVSWVLGKLGDLGRTELNDEDSRIFPGWYAPVMVVQHGRRVVRPMRYQCRLPGKPAFHDAKFPGTYNARRDSLGGYWQGLFGHAHGALLVDGFYEHVSRPRGPGQPAEKVVLQFEPQPATTMLVACLWSKWSAPGEDELLSFAAITDAPPPEIAAAGHDRCVIPLKPENLDAWLDPRGDSTAMQAILDDRPATYYEHQLAA